KDMTDPAKDFIFGSWTNIGRPAALKTGTTDNLRDVYSVGFVPQLVTGIWMGNSNNLEMSSRDFSSAMGPGVLWQTYMKEAIADMPKQDWERPSNIVTVNVVSAPGAFGGYGSGLLPSSLSPFSMPENFIKGTQPARQDDWFVTGCAKSDGTRSVALQLKESAPEGWQRYTDKWVADANAGKHTYGRYSWNVMGSQPCPSPSPTPAPGCSRVVGSTTASPSRTRCDVRCARRPAASSPSWNASRPMRWTSARRTSRRSSISLGAKPSASRAPKLARRCDGRSHQMPDSMPRCDASSRMRGCVPKTSARSIARWPRVTSRCDGWADAKPVGELTLSREHAVLPSAAVRWVGVLTAALWLAGCEPVALAQAAVSITLTLAV